MAQEWNITALLAVLVVAVISKGVWLHVVVVYVYHHVHIERQNERQMIRAISASYHPIKSSFIW